MRPLSSGRPLAIATAALLLVALTAPAGADPGSDDSTGTPTQEQVDQARDAVAGKQRSVAAVRTDLVLANQRLEAFAVEAAQAAEAYNAARWKLSQAQAEVKAADARAARATKALAKQEQAYGDMVATSYEASPQLQTIEAVMGEDGLDGLVETTTTTYQVATSMDEIRDAYDAAAEVADLATEDAQQARDAAEDLNKQAEAAHDEAQARAEAAAAETERVTRAKDRLIAELAQLENISVTLAARRQSDLEAAAQARAAAAAQAAAEQEAREQEARNTPPPADPTPAPNPAPNPEPQPDPTPDPDPAPQPDPTPPPPSTSGAQRAIAFARAQIGEPYVWAADGPDSWDCSGLTMRAWQAGGKYLPHYSVGQYSTATPIRSSALQPGDLVFWGSSSDPSSIHHVALYVGNGRIVHAPRTGRPVTEESMYYWVPPNFFARP